MLSKDGELPSRLSNFTTGMVILAFPGWRQSPCFLCDNFDTTLLALIDSRQVRRFPWLVYLVECGIWYLDYSLRILVNSQVALLPTEQKRKQVVLLVSVRCSSQIRLAPGRPFNPHVGSLSVLQSVVGVHASINLSYRIRFRFIERTRVGPTYVSYVLADQLIRYGNARNLAIRHSLGLFG